MTQPQENVERIEQLRTEIDALDRDIVLKLVERARLAHEVGLAKGGTAVYRPERERVVIEKALATARQAQALMADSALAAIYQEIMSACRAVEGQPRVAYLGPAGTFTEMAVLMQFGHGIVPQPCESIDATFHAVESGQADFAVVPIENSTQGSVTRTLDLLFTTQLNVVAEVNVAVQHNLMSRQSDLSQIKEVTAHPQALAQCRAWLNKNLPHARQIPASSNAEAAVEASKTPGLAAIAARRAAEIYDLQILAAAIQDDPRNRTRFLVLGRNHTQRIDAAPNKTSIVFSVPNRAGCLLTALVPFSEHGVSMTRLESRPAGNGAWEYNFFVDLEGHSTDAPVAAALNDIRAIANFFKILGSYPQAPEYHN